jgi:uncharacterized membrane protein (UPF0127 family)
MLLKKSSNTSNSTPSEHLKKTASARKVVTLAGLQALAIIFVMAGLMFWWRDHTAKVRVGDAAIQVEVADTEQERQEGLSSKIHLADNHGMLFVFPHDAPWAMWMKDMQLPIDIVWIDANKKVVHVESGVRPESYPAYYAPPQNARYVLELASGVAAKSRIQTGVQADFDVAAATK